MGSPETCPTCPIHGSPLTYPIVPRLSMYGCADCFKITPQSLWQLSDDPAVTVEAFAGLPVEKHGTTLPPTPPAPAASAVTRAEREVVEAREIDDERYSFFYAALAYAKARSLARTGADVTILGATEAIFDRAFENLGDDATWLSVAAERRAALRGKE